MDKVQVVLVVTVIQHLLRPAAEVVDLILAEDQPAAVVVVQKRREQLVEGPSARA